jgi:hypothetical protein
MKQTNKQTMSLQRIEIATPCMASWDDMKGDQRVRHCDDCNKKVFNLSAMPEAAAVQLLADNHGGALCVRFYQRQDGTLMTGDCGDSQRAVPRQAWRRLPRVAGAALLALSAAAGANAADGGAPATVPVTAPAMTMMMGAPPPPPPSPEQQSKIAAPLQGQAIRNGGMSEAGSEASAGVAPEQRTSAPGKGARRGAAGQRARSTRQVSQ